MLRSSFKWNSDISSFGSAKAMTSLRVAAALHQAAATITVSQREHGATVVLGFMWNLLAGRLARSGFVLRNANKCYVVRINHKTKMNGDLVASLRCQRCHNRNILWTVNTTSASFYQPFANSLLGILVLRCKGWKEYDLERGGKVSLRIIICHIEFIVEKGGKWILPLHSRILFRFESDYILETSCDLAIKRWTKIGHLWSMAIVRVDLSEKGRFLE